MASGGRRSSILKLPKIILDDDDEDQQRQSRKVRFSSNFVKPYTTQENTTVWDRTYEEPIQDSSSKASSEKTCTDNTNTEMHNFFGDISTGPKEFQQPSLTSGIGRGACVISSNNKTIYDENNMELTMGVSNCLEQYTAGCIFNPSRNNQHVGNKTVLDETGMELTEVVPSFGIIEGLADLDKGANRNQNKTVLQDKTMEFTEAIHNFDIVAGHAFKSHNQNKTMLQEKGMDLTEAVPNFGIVEQNKTMLQEKGMELTEAVPNFGIIEELGRHVPNPHKKGINKRNRTILQEKGMELTEAAPNFGIIEELGRHVPNPHKEGINKQNRTILQEKGMELTEAAPNFGIIEELGIHKEGINKRNRSILQEKGMELTESVPNFGIIEELGRHVSNSYKEATNKRNKTMLQEKGMELTQAVSDFGIIEQNKTMFEEKGMDLTEAVPSFGIIEELGRHVPNKGNKTVLQDISMELTQAIDGDAFNFNNQNNTVLQEKAMEFTAAVPNFGIAEELAKHFYISHKENTCSRNKTVLQEMDMDITEAASPHKINIGNQNKTILHEIGMEITQAVPNIPIFEEMVKHAFNSHVQKNKIDLETPRHRNKPDDLQPHLLDFDQSLKNYNKTIIGGNEMEFTQAVSNFMIQENLNDIAAGYSKPNYDKELRKDHTSREIKGKKPLSEINKNNFIINQHDNKNHQVELLDNNKENQPEQGKKKPPGIIITCKDDSRELDSTSIYSMKSKNVSTIYSKSLLLQNRLIEDALSSGNKQMNAGEPSYDELQIYDFSNVLAEETSYEHNKLRRLSSKCGSFNIFEDISGVELLREVDDMEKRIALEEEKSRLESNAEFTSCVQPHSFNISKNYTCSFQNTTKGGEVEKSRFDISNQLRSCPKPNISINTREFICDDNVIENANAVFSPSNISAEVLSNTDRVFKNTTEENMPKQSFTCNISKNTTHLTDAAGNENMPKQLCSSNISKNTTDFTDAAVNENIPKQLCSSNISKNTTDFTNTVFTEAGNENMPKQSCSSNISKNTTDFTEALKNSTSKGDETNFEKGDELNENQFQSRLVNMLAMIKDAFESFEVTLNDPEIEEIVSESQEILKETRFKVRELLETEREIMGVLDELEVTAK